MRNAPHSQLHSSTLTPAGSNMVSMTCIMAPPATISGTVMTALERSATTM